MSNNDKQTKTLAVRHDAPIEWGKRTEIAALADRFSTMLPNAKDLNRNQILAAAQYCRLMDLNPFRGEVYFFPGKGGNLAVVDGYKALTRWAADKAEYSDWYESLPLDEGEVYKYRCWVLRDDRKVHIKEWVEMGATFQEAREMAAHYADGVVTKSDTMTRDGRPKDPPTGWTWDQVARKRALKNALNLSHGAPSPREMAELSWKVNGTQTIPDDWDGTEELSAYEAERLAELRATDRERQAEFDQLTDDEKAQRLAENSRLLHGDPDFEGFGDGPDYAQAEVWDAGEEETQQEEEPATIRKAKGAQVKTQNWAASFTSLKEDIGYYKNGYHATGAAWKMGYQEITDDNLADVLDALRQYAQDQQAQLPL